MPNLYRVAFMAILILVAGAAAQNMAASSAGDAHPALISVEPGPGEGVYTLICRGTCRHELFQDAGLRQVTVDLPGVANGMEPGDLPAPTGVVASLTLGESSNSTQLVFALLEPVAARAGISDRGLEVRLTPSMRDPWAGSASARPLGSEDLIEINVFEVPQLSRIVRISGSGKVSLPLLGDVVAAGLTPRELEMELRDRLSRK